MPLIEHPFDDARPRRERLTDIRLARVPADLLRGADGVSIRRLQEGFREYVGASRTAAGNYHMFPAAFSRSHKTPIAWTSTKGPILNFAEGEGLSLPSGCRVGECESCAAHIASGCVRYLNGVESEDPSVCLTCSAVPASNLVLDA
jgi:ferredoxin